MDDASGKCPNGFKITVMMMMVVIFSLRFFVSNSANFAAESTMLQRDDDDQLKKKMRMVLGSSPPRCVNRCMSCRPCTATLVTSPHHQNTLKAARYQGDESYYLLAWKCKCRNKLFQP